MISKRKDNPKTPYYDESDGSFHLYAAAPGDNPFKRDDEVSDDTEIPMDVIDRAPDQPQCPDEDSENDV